MARKATGASAEEVSARLGELARNFRWVWDLPTQEVFRAIDQTGWDRDRDPLALVNSLTPERLTALGKDKPFRDRLIAVAGTLGAYLAEKPAEPAVAYFCMEHGIAPTLRSYAGGLGMLAGCIEKTASDLGVPMVAVGLRYGQWFRQRLDFGWQHEIWQDSDPVAAGLQPCPEQTTVELAGEQVVVRIWRAQVGRVDLYLLDTDVEENPEHLRSVTDRLYGGDAEHRLRQEVVLGVGGVRALRALGLAPKVYHANEGHAAFMSLERIEALVGAGASVDQAVAAVRASTVFTTHTAVPAGFDLFDRALIDRYFGDWAHRVGVSVDWLVGLGHFADQYPDEPFNMALLSTRLSGQVNAVSKLHREVTESRVLGPLWPGRSAPVRWVTNGVHPRTWTPAPLARLFDRQIGEGWDYADAEQWNEVWQIPDAELWAVRQQLRAGMVEAIREYLPRTLAEHGWTADLGWAAEVLDPQALTVVVARRSAEYKETDLLVSLPERLTRLVHDTDRPLRVIVAGLAHPKDEGGKERIRRIVEFSLREEIRHAVVYLPGYDMRLATLLLAGADVWLNHPRRGDEACGTSFMKSVYCGGRIMTTPDGGADELIVDGDNGWLIGDRTYGASRETMAHNAFELLEQAVIPEFYDRDVDGLPGAWVAGIKRSLGSLAWQVSSVGMVRAYQRLYRQAERSAVRQRVAELV